MLDNFISTHPIMTNIIIGIFIGISMTVAVVAAIITYANLRSPRQKSAIAVKKEPLAETKTASAPREKPPRQTRAATTAPAPSRKKKWAFIQSRRSSRRDDTSSDQLPVVQELPVPETTLAPALNMTSPEPELNAELNLSLPLPPPQPVSELTEVATVITDPLPAEPAEFTQPQTESELVNPEVTSATEDNEHAEPPASEKDDLFSLFTDDKAEESSRNKLAADLSGVDVDDLLAEVLKFRNQFRKAR